VTDPMPLDQQLRKLCLVHMAGELEAVLAAAAKDNLAYKDVLARLVDIELVGRHENRVKRLIHEASVVSHKSLNNWPGDFVGRQGATRGRACRWQAFATGRIGPGPEGDTGSM